MSPRVGISQRWARDERDEIRECGNEVDVYHVKICSAAKERRESVASTKRENVEEEAQENKDGLGSGRG